MATQESAEIVLQQGVHHLLRDIDGVPFQGTDTIPTFTIWNCIDQSIFEIPNDASTKEFFVVCLPTDTSNSPKIPDQMTHESVIYKAGQTYKNLDVAPRRRNSKIRHVAPLSQISVAPATQVSVAPASQVSVAPASQVSVTPQPQVFIAPQPQVSIVRQTQVSIAPQPQVEIGLQLQVPIATQPQVSDVPKLVASWKDEKAVQYLLATWKDYKEFFDSTTIRNEAVWCLIAGELAAANNTWVYSGPQCENKFKDVRKCYVRVRDHNNQTGVEPKTCKFYDDMENILGDKPCVKPVAVASNRKKRAADTASIVTVDQECPDNEGLEAGAVKKNTKRKKTRVQRELDEWNQALRADALKRGEAQEKRHLEGKPSKK